MSSHTIHHYLNERWLHGRRSRKTPLLKETDDDRWKKKTFIEVISAWRDKMVISKKRISSPLQDVLYGDVLLMLDINKGKLQDAFCQYIFGSWFGCLTSLTYSSERHTSISLLTYLCGNTLNWIMTR